MQGEDRSWVSRLPVKSGSVVRVRSHAGDLFLGHPERCNIAKSFYWHDGLRDTPADQFAFDLFTDLAAHSDVVLDIGASTGLFALAAAKANPDATILAFDILPEAYHLLIDNILLNNAVRAIEPHLAGVGARGVFSAPLSTKSSSLPTGLSLNWRNAWESQQRADVPIRTLDEICLPRFEGRKLLIKIDVEEAEAAVFAGGEATIRTLKPDILCEVVTPKASDVEGYDALLTSAGYQKFLITDRGFQPTDKVWADPDFRDWFFSAGNCDNLPRPG